MSYPYPPETWATIGPGGYENTLGGDPGEWCCESHTQDANVAEVNYGKPVIGEPHIPSHLVVPL